MLNRTTQRAIVVATLVATLTGCSTSQTMPTSPTRGPHPGPAVSGNPPYRVAEVTLSGHAFEMTPSGRRPIEGVAVLNGEGNWDTTDGEGFYSFAPLWVCPCPAQPWVPANMTFVWVEKTGYTNPPGMPASVFGSTVGLTGARDVMIDGDTRFDIELIRK